MKRREAIKNTSLWVSGMLIVPSSSVILSSCERTHKNLEWTPKFFSESNANLINEIIDTLIPNTETPGAVAADVPQFVESFVQNVYDIEKRDWFVNELSKFNQRIKKVSSKSFFDLDLSTKIKTLNKIQVEDSLSKKTDHYGSFYMDLKRRTITGYFKSEIGATQALNYRAIPGAFRGCIPLEENGGKSWS